MDEDAPATDQRLDELYREHPDGFVAGRDRLVKELRAAGEREGAERVRKLRRPTAAAWLINRAALEAPLQLRELAEAGRALEDAQRRALEGEDAAAAEWRAAAGRWREATAAIVEAADSLARDAGRPAGQRALELVGETLRAAAGDAELRERVLGGRLEREQATATLGTPAAAPPRGRTRKEAKRREQAQAKRELRRLQGELAEAEARGERLRERVGQAAEALRKAQARLADGEQETAELSEQVKAAERRAEG